MANLNPNSFTNVVPIPGFSEFKGLGPKSKPPHWRDGEGQVIIGGWPIQMKWIMDAWMLPALEDYKRFCELVCANAALKAGYTHVHIRSVLHNTTNNTRYVPRHKRQPGDFDWHITADFGPPGPNKVLPQSAHLWIGPLNEWHGEKDEVTTERMGVWRPGYAAPIGPLPSIEWFKIREKSAFSAKPPAELFKGGRSKDVDRILSKNPGKAGKHISFG